MEITIAAEESGFDGFFAWDHVLSPVPGSWDIADPWVLLGAVAARNVAVADRHDGDAVASSPDRQARTRDGQRLIGSVAVD